MKGYIEKGFIKYNKLFSNNEIQVLIDLVNDAIINVANNFLEPKKKEEFYCIPNERIPHEGMIFLFNIDPELATKAINQLNSSYYLYSFMTNNKILDKYKELTSCPDDKSIATNAFFVRVDLPSKYKKEDLKFSLPWHQESGYYHKNISKSKSVVVWVPLFDVSKESGALEVIPCSHSNGYVIHDEYYINPEEKTKFRVSIPENVISKYDQKNNVFTEAIQGDVYIMNFNLMHRSGLNVSNDVRYTFLARYSNKKDVDYSF